MHGATIKPIILVPV